MPVPIMFATTMHVAVNGEMVLASFSMEGGQRGQSFFLTMCQEGSEEGAKWRGK